MRRRSVLIRLVAVDERTLIAYAQRGELGVKPVNVRWVGWVVLSLLAACSGGGSGGGGGAVAPTLTAVPTASSTTTAVPTLAASPSPTASATAVPTLTLTPTKSATAVFTATPTSTSTLTFTPTPTSTLTSTPMPTVTLTPEPTASFTPAATPTSIPSAVPTATPTPTPLTGPIVSAFGIADGSGTFNAAVDTDPHGRSIFVRQEPAGFVIYVEGRPGPSRLPVGTDRFATRPGDPTRQPDLQIESSNNLGDGSVGVCDNSFPNVGGVPGISLADFSPIQSVSDALNDLSCRFKVFAETDFACTQDSSGNFLFGNASSTVQFCTLVSDTLTFPHGDTVLTVRLLDTAGNAGQAVQIIVRIIGGP